MYFGSLSGLVKITAIIVSAISFLVYKSSLFVNYLAHIVPWCGLATCLLKFTWDWEPNMCITYVVKNILITCIVLDYFFLALRFDTKLMVGNLKQSYIRHKNFRPSFVRPQSITFMVPSVNSETCALETSGQRQMSYFSSAKISNFFSLNYS